MSRSEHILKARWSHLVKQNAKTATADVLAIRDAWLGAEQRAKEAFNRLRELCQHPLDQLYCDSKAAEDTLGNFAGYSRYHIECRLCRLWLETGTIDSSSNEIKVDAK